MKIYHAHPVTGEYLRATDARPDPREPGRFLVPANAYTDAPGSPPAGKVMVRSGGKWVAKAPTPAPNPSPDTPGRSLTFRQLVIGLTREEWITLAEGREWLKRNSLPANAVALLETAYPEDGQDRFEAEANMLGISQADRDHPMVAALAQHAGKTEAEVDAFFATYAGV